MRRIFIGDIHGCYEQLCALLDAVRLDRESDELIFVGDYIDRGPASFDVFLRLKELKEQMGDRCTLLCGNHEEIAAGNDFRFWQENGSLNTIRSWGTAMIPLTQRKKRAAYLEFLDGRISSTKSVSAHKRMEGSSTGLPFCTQEKVQKNQN